MRATALPQMLGTAVTTFLILRSGYGDIALMSVLLVFTILFAHMSGIALSAYKNNPEASGNLWFSSTVTVSLVVLSVVFMLGMPNGMVATPVAVLTFALYVRSGFLSKDDDEIVREAVALHGRHQDLDILVDDEDEVKKKRAANKVVARTGAKDSVK